MMILLVIQGDDQIQYLLLLFAESKEFFNSFNNADFSFF